MFHVNMVHTDNLDVVCYSRYILDFITFLETVLCAHNVKKASWINKLKDGSIRVIFEDASTRCPLTDIDSHIPAASNLVLL